MPAIHTIACKELLDKHSSISTQNLPNLGCAKAGEKKKAVQRCYKVIFEPQEEGGYTVTVPALPGSISEGDSYDEATANIKEAIELHIESLESDGLPIPPEKHLFAEVELSHGKTARSKKQ